VKLMALGPGSGRLVRNKAINFSFPAPFAHFVRCLAPAGRCLHVFPTSLPGVTVEGRLVVDAS